MFSVGTVLRLEGHDCRLDGQRLALVLPHTDAGWILYVCGGKQSLEIEDSQKKTKNISRFYDSVQCLRGFIFVRVF